MPWDYRYQRRRDFFIFHAKGEIHDDDLIKGNHAVVSDPNFRPDSRVFLDFSSVDEFKLSNRWLETLNAREAVQNIRGKHAFLIFGPFGSLGFHEYLKSLCCSSWFRMFTTRKDAYDWLNEDMPLGKHISGGPWHTVAHFDVNQAERK